MRSVIVFVRGPAESDVFAGLDRTDGCRWSVVSRAVVVAIAAQVIAVFAFYVPHRPIVVEASLLEREPQSR